MRSRWFIALVVASTLGCSGGADEPKPVVTTPMLDAGPAPAKAAVAGRIEVPQGAVSLTRGGAVTRVNAPGDLFVGDVVETGDDGSAELRIDGRVIELGPEGRFELGDSGSGLVLTVARGLVITRVSARPVDAGPSVFLTISTPFGLTRVGAEQGVKVAVEATRASVEVQVGEIELVSKSGDVTRLSASAGKPAAVLGAPRELPTITLVVVAALGRAEVKAKAAKAYLPINPKKLPPLAAGDSVRVVEGRLTLAPEGSPTRLTLVKGAELELAEAHRSDQADDTSVDLKKGEVQVQSPSGQKTGLAIGGGISLQSDLGAQYSVRRSGSGVEVQSQVGDLRITWSGHDEVALPSGGLAVLAGAAPKVTAATREVLQLPTHNGLKVFETGVARAALTWDAASPDAGTGMSWRVVVASDAAFSSVLLDGLVHEPFVNVAIPARGPLYWRVYEGAGTEEKFRGNALFTPEVSALDLSRAKNIVPDGPDTTTIYFQDKPPTVTFTWQAGEGVAKYSIKVYREGELTKPVAERTVTESQASLPESTLAEGKYLWSVTALDQAGREVKGGRLNKLHMVYDNAVPQLVIRSPRAGEVGRGPVRVAGIAPVGARVVVNGRPMALDESARFDSEVAPLPGGRIIFRVFNAGVETFTVRTVRR